MQTHTVRFSQTVQEHRAPTRHGTVWEEPEGSCGLPKRAGAISQAHPSKREVKHQHQGLGEMQVGDQAIQPVPDQAG